ncbi:hypothetical protein M413DRAFT_446385 [Hebeloma cylindrosporum]|uniref:Uncharacterized protein n=1 Tax=Hebeloma cylindrosporum TaxID=76867 RepID=A0A0C2XRH8_HEBCY|nr:hypothetical protein M413DRAFT_446385 [Hebeloma cylindrosporum h7]
MNLISPVFDHMHTDDPQYSRWSYNTSYARSEPLPPQRPHSQIVPPSLLTPSPPPPSKPRLPMQISTGVWLEDQGFLYSSEYPPVQKYLEETRGQRTFLRPPSEVILALAALDVAEHPEDPAHWIIWNLASFNDIQERVDKVFLEQPKRIKTRVPWLGKSYRPTLVARQLKYECVHIQHRWYATGVGEKGSAAADTRRATRSSGTNDEVDITAAQHFDLFPNKPHLLKEHTSKPVPPPAKRTKRSATKRKPPFKRGPKPTVEEDAPFEKRMSTRVRRKISASDRSPRILSSAGVNLPSISIDDPAEVSSSISLADSSSSTPTHTRNRSSSSQASNETLVQSARSPSVAASVASATTAVGSSSPKKRKALELEEEDGEELPEPAPPKRMATRGRPPKVPPIDSEKGSTSSRTSTPTVDSKAKLSRPRTKKTRAS